MMEYQLTQVSNNVHAFKIDNKKRHQEFKYMLLSDLHFDNPKCKREVLRNHLNQALDQEVPVLINGDFFCIMQGKGDRRHAKEDVRPQHQKNDYLQSVIDEAVEWFEPYKEIIKLIGYGNHETAIIKFQERDVLKAFVEKFNYVHKPKKPLYLGGYGGYVLTKFDEHQTHNNRYHHGHGGGGVVTKGIIQHQRMQTFVANADVIWQGHVHEDYENTTIREVLSLNKKIEFKETLNIRTSAYKEEFKEGKGGFHVERGAPPKPIGGRWLTLNYSRKESGITLKQSSSKIIDNLDHFSKNLYD